MKASGAAKAKRPEDLADVILRWREDPVAFVRENFEVEPDAWQVDALTYYSRHQRLAMKACKGPGKSAVLAWIALHFMTVWPMPKGACTSISLENLRDGLWSEIAKWYNRSTFLKQAFQFTKTRLVGKEAPDTWWLSARAWSRSADKAQQADTLAGLHADYILFLIDEAGGVPDSVMAAAEAALSTGIVCKIVLAGNPTMLSGPLYRACTKETHLWKIVEITGDPDDKKRSPRISVEWARQQIEKYGRDNPWVLVNVFGKFPPSSLDALLGIDDCNESIRRNPKVEDFHFSPKILGVDVARFGDDRSVIFPRQGICAFEPRVFRNLDNMTLASQIAKAYNKWDADAIIVDSGGGAGVIDRLRQLGYDPIEVNFGSRPRSPKYQNRRAEMLHAMSLWVKETGCIPDDDELVDELVAPTYWYTPTGTMAIEPKDSVKERLGKSPDLADALALTFAEDIGAKYMKASDQMAGGKAEVDYNPLIGQRGNDYDPLRGA